MIGKVTFKSYSAVSSRFVRRKCPHCLSQQDAEEVDYGEGGKVVFLSCGTTYDPRKKKAYEAGIDCHPFMA